MELFPFSRIEKAGKLIGFGVACCRHSNRDGYAAKTPCKKAISIGNNPVLSQSEASLRLKRWLVVGQMHPLDPDRERQSHIALGGTSLCDLSSETEWGEFPHADLDFMIDKL